MKDNNEKELWQDRKRITLFALPLSFTKYRLTNTRLFISKGLLTTQEDEVRLYRITDVSLKKTLLQKMFGIGTVLCISSDKSLGSFELKNIKNPNEVKELLSVRVEEERMSHRVIAREHMIDLDDAFDEI